MDLHSKPAVYMAGPDVFYPDAAQRGELMKYICKKYGFTGVFPLDNEITGNSNQETANNIFRANTEDIKSCDIIAANLTPFRGAEPDSGTAFECGFGYGQGKILYGYCQENSTTAEKVKKHYGACFKGGTWMDKDGLLIEDFDLQLNLMLSVPIKLVIGDFEDCIYRIYKDMKKEKIILNNKKKEV